MKYDVIVIGAGLGGLVAGAKLAREGRKVLVIEQHDRPGGCATTFQRGDFTLEVGLHEMDGPSPRDMKTRIFNDLEVTGNVEFLHVPEFYRFVNGRYDVTVKHNPEEMLKTLSELFPDESEGIKTYFSHVLAPKTGPADQANMSVGEYLDSIIKNDDLKLILLGNLGYFHDDPYSLSLAYYLVAQGSYYSGGASYIKGGSQKLSDHLTTYIRNHSGEVLLKHIVTGITTSGNKVESVVCRKKGSTSGIVFYADDVIANNAIPDLPGLITGPAGQTLKEEFAGLREGASLLTLYLGFSKPPSAFGNRHYSTAVFDSSVKTQADILKNNNDDFSRRSFIFVDYSIVDSGLAPAGKSVGAICCIDYLADWQGLEKSEYRARKERIATVLIERLDRIIPGVKSAVEYYEIGTPATVKRYTMNPGGAVYGFAQTPSRKIIESFRSVENLHIASAWGKTGGGFSGAIFGGYLCAYNILRKRPAAKT